MIVAETIDELRKNLKDVRVDKPRLALVPTMGYLHEGHLSLVKIAKQQCDCVAASIFVNPKQFNNPTDLEKYPRDMKRDCEMLAAAGVDLVFTPLSAEIYPPGFQSSIVVSDLTQKHEGAFRPGHFAGVTTVVGVLFNLFSPHAAVFGEKDFQQLRVIEQMVSDLGYDIRIVRGPLVREADGLAMSSRNARLAPEEREAARLVSKSLFSARAAFHAGECDAAKILETAGVLLNSSPLVRVDYLSLVDERMLEEQPTAQKDHRLLLAAHVGSVRLIDTLALA